MIEFYPEAQILRLFDSEGNYRGPAERIIVVNGEFINIDDWATENGVTLPDAGD
jgi:hypothetical protein